MRKLLIVLLGVIFLITPFCYAAWKFNPHTNRLDFYEDVETTSGWSKSGTSIYPTTITDNVGIGTTLPIYTLQVAGTTASQTLQFGTAYNNILPAGTGAGGQVMVGNVDGTMIWADTSAGSASLWIENGSDIGYSAGNVGIGTTAPKGLLQVGTSPNPPLLITNTNVGIGNTNPLGLLQVGTNPAKPGLLVLPNNNVGIGWTSPVGLLQVSTTSSSGLVVLPNGNVGIGTTNPARILQVVGDYARIGDGGTINFADGDGDLYVEDELEVDGITTFSSTTIFTYPMSSGGAVRIYDDAGLYLGTSYTNVLTQADEQTNIDGVMLGLWCGGNFYDFIICDSSDTEVDFLHPAAAIRNPRVWIHSADATKIKQYGGFYHDQTDFNLEVGSGRLLITSGSTAPTDLLYIRSAGTGTNMALRIANTTPTDILAVLDNQRVGIGTTLPTTPLTIIASNTAPANNLYLSGTAGARLIISSPDASCSSCGVDNSDVWSCISVTCP